MDLKGHSPQNTISRCIISTETQLTLHFFNVEFLKCQRQEPIYSWQYLRLEYVFVNFISFLSVLLFWFQADQGLKKVGFITFLKLVKISYDSE